MYKDNIKLNENSKKKINLTTKIFLGLIFGVIFGLILHYFIPTSFLKDTLIIGSLDIIGKSFIRLMQMLVVPLVFFSIIDGCRSIGDTKTLGKVGIKIVIYFICTTLLAISISLILSSALHPGKGLNMVSNNVKSDINTDISFKDTIISMIPKNPIESLAKGDMIQIVLFSVIFALVISKLEDKVDTIGQIITEANDIMMKMTSFVMKLAPIGVFCLIANTFSSLGYSIILSMFSYISTVFTGLLMQLFIVYMLLFVVFTRENPFIFLRNFKSVITFAFSTSSSSATVPINIKTLNSMGVSNKISSFTIPMGATINMDGTAIMQGVAVVFIANAYNIDLQLKDYFTVIITATIASIGTAGIPSVGVVTLAMVLNSVGLPAEGIAMIMGIDRIVDMARTAINICGDGIGTIIIAKQEHMFDKNKFKMFKL